MTATMGTDIVDRAYIAWRQATAHAEYGPYEARQMAKELASAAEMWATATVGGDVLVRRQERAAQPRSKRGARP